MFGSSGAGAYAKVKLETGIIAASPHQLIAMLFDGATVAMNLALEHMKAGQFEEKGKAITKAIRIVDEGLRASLDRKAGGEIAANLDALYGHVIQRLLHANLRNDTAAVQECLRLLAELKGAWDAIAPAGAASPAAAAPQRAAAFDAALTPRTATFVAA